MTEPIKLPPLPLSRCGYYTGSDVLEYAQADAMLEGVNHET